jgi:hypothetical protein
MIDFEKVDCIVTWINALSDYNWEGPMTRTKANELALEVASNNSNSDINICVVVGKVVTSPRIVDVE